MTDRTLDACADSLLDCRREVLALKADLARCYDVCAEAIGSEYRNVGVVEACAQHLDAVRADLAAEREARERAEEWIAERECEDPRYAKMPAGADCPYEQRVDCGSCPPCRARRALEER